MPKHRLDASTVAWCRVATAQFVWAVPLLTVVGNFIMLERAAAKLGEDDDRGKLSEELASFRLAVAFLEGASVGISFWGMFVVYCATLRDPLVARMRPVLKLLLVRPHGPPAAAPRLTCRS